MAPWKTRFVAHRNRTNEHSYMGSLIARNLAATEQIGRKLDYTRGRPLSGDARNNAQERAAAAGARRRRLLVPELLDAPVLLRDLRLEFIYTSLSGLEDALHLGLVRERKRVIDRDAHALFGLFDLLL